MTTALVMSVVGTTNCYAEEPVNWQDDLKYESETVISEEENEITYDDYIENLDENPKWNEYGSYEVQKIMWDYLMERIGNPIGAAAVMGNAGVESNFCPWRYVGCCDVDESYISAKKYVDNCSEGEFVYNWMYVWPEGFGLFQFSTNPHMQNLWDLAEEKGVAVYDVTLQTEYMMNNVERKVSTVYEYLKTTDDLMAATEMFRARCEASVYDIGSVNHRINRALEVYERFMGEPYDGEIYFPYWAGSEIKGASEK